MALLGFKWDLFGECFAGITAPWDSLRDLLESMLMEVKGALGIMSDLLSYPGNSTWRADNTSGNQLRHLWEFWHEILDNLAFGFHHFHVNANGRLTNDLMRPINQDIFFFSPRWRDL